jgi:hypothetical protein
MHDAPHPDSRHAKLSDITFRPLTVRGMPVVERRNPAARQALVTRVQGEFDEMPGTSLTVEQATRLFGMRNDVCVRILGELVTRGMLKRSADNRFRRSSAA